MSMRLSSSSYAVCKTPAARPLSRVAPRSNDRLRSKAGPDDKTKGVIPGLNQWPPKSFTDHGEPKPEDDPKNYDVVTGKRTGGPSEGEIQKKKDEANKDRTFSNPNREGGTQKGGGGEGVSS